MKVFLVSVMKIPVNPLFMKRNYQTIKRQIAIQNSSKIGTKKVIITPYPQTNTHKRVFVFQNFNENIDYYVHGLVEF
jgi:hypothetical protein